ncbi:MAG TPA: type II toxin-antitoxin system RelE/ParE family toxin [Armatimonadota bacterium]|nr:type II toxin-antitoxin system RelE/ParE family toxin [Armatimonadota bacterium]
MKVTWTDSARGHLQAIHDYVTQNASTYAQRMVDRLVARSEQIGDFPLSGSVVPEYDTLPMRQVTEGIYRITY